MHARIKLLQAFLRSPGPPLRLKQSTSNLKTSGVLGRHRNLCENIYDNTNHLTLETLQVQKNQTESAQIRYVFGESTQKWDRRVCAAYLTRPPPPLLRSLQLADHPVNGQRYHSTSRPMTAHTPYQASVTGSKWSRWQRWTEDPLTWMRVCAH